MYKCSECSKPAVLFFRQYLTEEGAKYVHSLVQKRQTSQQMTVETIMKTAFYRARCLNHPFVTTQHYAIEEISKQDYIVWEVMEA